MGERTCSVDGCDRPICNRRGWCSRHYARWIRHGDPLIVKYANTGRRTMALGYVQVRVGPGDWRYEHRHIWEQAHGPIPPGYHVHHVNGVRDDNRLENLELVNGARHNREHTTERHRNGSLNNHGSHSGRWRHDLDSDEIVRRRDAGESFRSIGRSMNTHHGTIKHHYDWSKGVMP